MRAILLLHWHRLSVRVCGPRVSQAATSMRGVVEAAAFVVEAAALSVTATVSNSIPPFPDQFFCADCQRIKNVFHPKLVCIHEHNYRAYNCMEGSAGRDRIPPADLGKWVILAISRGTLIFSRVCPTFWRATVLTRQFRRAVLGQLVRYGKFTNVV